MTIHDYIKKRKHLVWYVKDYDNLNVDSIVEATLNYGDLEDVQTLIKIIGIKEMAKIFRKQTNKKNMRCNYEKKIINYFTLYFNKYA